MKVWIVMLNDNQGNEVDSIHATEKSADARGAELKVPFFIDTWSVAGAQPYLRDYGDEPVFVLRARDNIAEWAVLSYMHGCIQAGLREQADEVDKARAEFRTWRAANPDLVKIPDHKHVSVTPAAPVTQP